ncbi:hypothetical protein [Ramlibacter sp.]|uniref:hypothetical protein n=1 Tax=Ramlibacter sp. TaxID=1917967 RepID=UPI002603251E|nr:hypothetical protein [Ramlibacter sp.]
MKEERLPDAGAAGHGDTVPVQGENQVPKARMPHERDESTDSQQAASPQVRRMGKIAHDSQVSGQQDTDKGPVLDAAYERQMGGDEKKRRQ